MTALLIASFVILLSYIFYAGTAESLSATYYKVKKPYLFQIALGKAEQHIAGQTARMGGGRGQEIP